MLCPGVAYIFLTVRLSYATVALYRVPCQKLLRDRKLATSSLCPASPCSQPHRRDQIFHLPLQLGESSSITCLALPSFFSMGLASCGSMGSRIWNSLWLIEAAPHRGGSISLRPQRGAHENPSLVWGRGLSALSNFSRLGLLNVGQSASLRIYVKETVTRFVFMV